MRDENQIARAILRTALRRFDLALKAQKPRGVSPISLRNLEPYKRLSPERRLVLARMGALARWGSGTLGVMPKDSSNVDANRIAARTLAEALGEQPKTLPP